MKKLQRAFRRSLGAGITALLVLCLSVTAFADFAHGYLRYIVGDGSVTVTHYVGQEETVTVPAMIGGNPVNTIASGAFTDAESVMAIVLPETVTSVEEGAFGAWQSVVYNGVSPAAETGSSSAAEPAGDEPGAPEPEEEPPALAQPAGILTEDGKLITTDDEGNLVMVDTQTGVETVLDDSQPYTREADPAGGTVIRSGEGTAVSVESEGEVSFIDAENNRVTISTDGAGSTTRTVTGASGEQVFEEVEADVDADEPAPAAAPSAVPASAAAPTAEPDPVRRYLPIAAAVVLAIVVCAILLRPRKGKKESD